MKKITPKHAYNQKGILTPLSLAIRQDKHFLDSGLKEELQFCDGGKNVRHFKSKPNRTWQLIKANIGTNSESFEHYEAKMQFCNSKTLIIDDTAIVGHTAKVEYRIKEINKIVDVAFFDESGDLLIAIEVLHTNPKNYKDIIKFNQINTPIYENNINTGTTELISYGDNEKENEEKNRLLTTEIIEHQEAIERGTNRLSEQRERIEEVEEQIRMAGENYYRETEEIEMLEIGGDVEHNKFIEEARERLQRKANEIEFTTERMERATEEYTSQETRELNRQMRDIKAEQQIKVRELEERIEETRRKAFYCEVNSGESTRKIRKALKSIA